VKGPHVFQAGNVGPFTLEGTRSYLVGRSSIALIDPGPADGAHSAVLLEALLGASEGVLLATHNHPDHVEAGPELSRRTGLPLRGPFPSGGLPLCEGDRITTDQGELVVVETPGHAREHFAFLDPARGDLFVGDLLLGQGDTTWVGEYRGCVAEYLSSLQRIAELGARVLHPGHGPPLLNPVEAIERFRRHRLERIEAVWRASIGAPAGEDPELVERIVDQVYGAALAGTAREGARWAVRAAREYLGVAPFPESGAPTEGGGRLATLS